MKDRRGKKENQVVANEKYIHFSVIKLNIYNQFSSGHIIDVGERWCGLNFENILLRFKCFGDNENRFIYIYVIHERLSEINIDDCYYYQNH